MAGGGWAAALQGLSDVGRTAAQVYSTQWAQKKNTRNLQHRYRWAMNDMRKAGLNPILGFGGGTPGVSATAQPISLQSSSIGQVLLQAQRQADEIKKLKAETGQATAGRDLRKTQDQLAYQDVRLRDWMIDTQKATARKTEAEADRAEIEARMRAYELPSAKAAYDLDVTRPGTFLRWLNRASESLQGTARMGRDLRR